MSCRSGDTVATASCVGSIGKIREEIRDRYQVRRDGSR